jgi:hypothetical protein
MCIIGVTQFRSATTRISAQFNASLYVHYYHGPATLLVVPVPVPSHFLFFCMCHYNDPVTQPFHFLVQLAC